PRLPCQSGGRVLGLPRLSRILPLRDDLLSKQQVLIAFEHELRTLVATDGKVKDAEDDIRRDRQHLHLRPRPSFVVLPKVGKLGELLKNGVTLSLLHP